MDQCKHNDICVKYAQELSTKCIVYGAFSARDVIESLIIAPGVQPPVNREAMERLSPYAENLTQLQRKDIRRR